MSQPAIGLVLVVPRSTGCVYSVGTSIGVSNGRCGIADGRMSDCQLPQYLNNNYQFVTDTGRRSLQSANSLTCNYNNNNNNNNNNIFLDFLTEMG